jgi:hypothetical protein
MILSWGLLIAFTCLHSAPASAQSSGSGNQPTGHHSLTAILNDSRNDVTPPLSAKQKLSIMRANFEKSKSDAAELAALAKGLREDLDKPDVNVLSLEVFNRAEKIEKLAKKIREETKGY